MRVWGLRVLGVGAKVLGVITIPWAVWDTAQTGLEYDKNNGGHFMRAFNKTYAEPFWNWWEGLEQDPDIQAEEEERAQFQALNVQEVRYIAEGMAVAAIGVYKKYRAKLEEGYAAARLADEKALAEREAGAKKAELAALRSLSRVRLKAADARAPRIHSGDVTPKDLQEIDRDLFSLARAEKDSWIALQERTQVRPDIHSANADLLKERLKELRSRQFRVRAQRALVVTRLAEIKRQQIAKLNGAVGSAKKDIEAARAEITKQAEAAWKRVAELELELKTVEGESAETSLEES